MLTDLSSESMDECSCLSPSLDGQEIQILIQYITACFPDHYFLESNQYLGAEKDQTKSQFARRMLFYFLYSQLHVVQVVRYPKLLGESGLKCLS